MRAPAAVPPTAPSASTSNGSSAPGRSATPPRPHPAPTQAASSDLACEPARIVGIALELDVPGQRVTHAIGAMLDAGALGELLDLLAAAAEPNGEVATAAWRHILARDPLPAPLAAPRL